MKGVSGAKPEMGMSLASSGNRKNLVCPEDAKGGQECKPSLLWMDQHELSDLLDGGEKKDTQA